MYVQAQLPRSVAPWSKSLLALLAALGGLQVQVLGFSSPGVRHGRLSRHLATEASHSLPFNAEVLADLTPNAEPPSRKEVELLRFVTAYRTGLEAVVDATPYAPLLQAAAADAASGAGENLTFYAFIDTWVNNGTGRDVLYLNNVTGQCSKMRKTDGNGWLLHMDLLLWPRTAVDTRPRESLTLASGFYGGNFGFGRVSLLEGEVAEDGAALLLDSHADFSGIMGNPPVYECPNGPGDLQMPSLLGYAARQAAFLAERYGQDSNESQRFASDLLEMLVYPLLAPVNVTAVFNATSSVLASFDRSTLQPEVGMPVFYNAVDVYTDTHLSTMWLNITYPFNRSGEVVSVSNDTMVIALLHPCLPSGEGFSLPQLLMPKNRRQIPEQQALVDSVMRWGSTDAARKRPLGMVDEDLDAGAAEPLLLQPKAVGGEPRMGPQAPQELSPPRFLGRLLPGSASRLNASRQRFTLQPPPGEPRSVQMAESPANRSAPRACAVQPQRQGRLFARRFQLAQLLPGDRVVLQLTVTGHGWAMTTEQCGEYCHAVYRLGFNGRSTANVTQFRDDCHLNPINGSMQFGTWDEHRNGWCPGTVEPGFFLDVTDSVREGTNNLDFDVVVWSNRTGTYEPYTDLAGFAYGDQASLIVGLSLFVYGAPAVAAVRAAGGRPRSAAEAALLAGSSAPAALRPRRLVEDQAASSLLLQEVSPVLESRDEQRGRKLFSSPLGGTRRRVMRPADMPTYDVSLAEIPAPPPGDGFDYEARAPWYLYNQSLEGYPGLDSGAQVLPIFSGRLLQGVSRTVRAEVSAGQIASADWGKAALYMRLTKPPGLEYDHWDRVGSIGLVVDGRHVVDGTPNP